MKRSRWPIVIALLVSLLGAQVTRRWAIASRTTGTSAGGTSATGLSRMNSFALALMLGGLRGPLVMFLWPSAERQKNERNLEDFDTKIEWIRLLQAEFDSVHIFQIWNKAYNVSVQMANVGNKYVTVLDALEYANSVDAERPNNVNILTAIAQLYFDKLGSSDEKLYYQQRVRDETRARQPMVRVSFPVARRTEIEKRLADAGLPTPRLRASTDEVTSIVTVTIPKTVADAIRPGIASDVTFLERAPTVSNSGAQLRRRELDPVLDTDGKLLPRYTDSLTYLKEFEPYPYGVSTLALGYNYYKRAQILQRVNQQKHVQLTDTVVDRNPPIALRGWMQEEWERGRRAEIQAMNLAIPKDRMNMESTTAETMPDAEIPFRPLLDEAIADYDRSVTLIDAATREYREHMDLFKNSYTLYVVHLGEIHATQALLRADRDYLKLMVAPESEKSALRASSIKEYLLAIRLFRLHSLKYYVPDDLAAQTYPPSITKANIGEANLDDARIDELLSAAFNKLKSDTLSQGFTEITEFNQHVSRALARLNNLGAAP